jgi:hypothetical protein
VLPLKRSIEPAISFSILRRQMKTLPLLLMFSLVLAAATLTANPIAPGSLPPQLVKIPIQVQTWPLDITPVVPGPPPPRLVEMLMQSQVGPPKRTAELHPPPVRPQVVEAQVPTGLQGLVMLFALVAESLVVALLAWPGRWVSNAFRWLLITAVTCLGLILIPFGFWDIQIHTVADAFGWRVLLLETVVVVLEGLVLWWLLFQNSNRAKQRDGLARGASFRDSLRISLAGNAVSFLFSVVCLRLLS